MNNDVIRVAKQGDPGIDNNPGDSVFYITVIPQEDMKYGWDGDNKQ